VENFCNRMIQYLQYKILADFPVKYGPATWRPLIHDWHKFFCSCRIWKRRMSEPLLMNTLFRE
jgi:hypothetical protein